MTNKCLRCGYSWSARSSEPMRCPSCKSTRWNKEIIKDSCLRCGAEWIQRGGEVPKYCPICHSSMWNAEKIIHTCPKCGKTRTLRSNSRTDQCPVCDVYSARHRARNNTTKGTTAGINTVLHLWSDGKGQCLLYVPNEAGNASFYDKGRLIGQINIESLCKTQKLQFDSDADFHDQRYQDVFESAIKKIRFNEEVFSSRSANTGILRGLTTEAAKIIYLHETGMSPLPISLKLGIPFTTVMDTLENIPPIVRGRDLCNDRHEQTVVKNGKNERSITERV